MYTIMYNKVKVVYYSHLATCSIQWLPHNLYNILMEIDT